jgi:hypothetical protein
MLIDQILPRYDEREYHQIELRGNPTQVYQAVRALDFSDSFLIRILFGLRGLPATLKSVDDLLEAGFVLVDELPGKEFVLGLIGRFWAPTAKLENGTGNSTIRGTLKLPGILQSVKLLMVQ